jgi:UDPglucose 6-dehydrogenase
MRIQIIGVGVVGTFQAFLASQLGQEVLGFDHHKTKSEHAKMLDDMEQNVDVTFICTPETTVEEVVGQLVQKKSEGRLFIKSTVPPRTTRKLMEKYGIHICHNPEFLREKTAFEDVTHPHVVVIGQCCGEHSSVLRSFYLPLGSPIIVTEPTMSETLKVTQNSYLAMLISFWNEIDKVTSAMGLSTEELAGMAKLNPRVSGYGTEFFGSPFGGKCLPKDLNQLIEFSSSIGVKPELLEAIRDFNKKLADAHPV